MDALVARGVVFKAQAFAFSPVFLGADWALGEPAATGWANIGERPVHAICAIGAFIAADARLRRLGREIAITQFAIRPKLEHYRTPFLSF